MAEFERERIRERTVAGLRAVRARGAKIERPGKVTVTQRQEIAPMKGEGRSVRQIARVVVT